VRFQNVDHDIGFFSELFDISDIYNKTDHIEQ